MFELFILTISSGAFFNFSKSVDLFTISVAGNPVETQITQVRGENRFGVNEVIKYGDFTHGYEGWSTSGEYGIATDCYEVKNCLVLGSLNSQTEFSYASTDFYIGEDQPSTLTLTIRADSSEYLLGFDKPSFAVVIDDQVIFWESFDQLLSYAGKWKQVQIALPALEPGYHKLLLAQLNTGDNKFSSQIKIASISTAMPLMGIEDHLEIKASNDNHTVFAEITTGNQSDLISAPGQLRIFSDQIMPAAIVSFWSVDDQGKTGEVSWIKARSDQTHPSVPGDISVYHETSDSLLIVISAWETEPGFLKVREKFSQLPVEVKAAHPLLTEVPKHQDWKLNYVGDDAKTELFLTAKSAEVLEISAIDQAGNQSAWVELPLEIVE